MSATSGSGDLLDDLQGHLIDQGIVRSPTTVDSTNTIHPLYKDPRTGAIAPKQTIKGRDPDDVMVLTAIPQTPIAVGPYESWYYKPCVQFVIRAVNSKDVHPMAQRLMVEFDDRRSWTTTRGLYVIESGIYRQLARIGSDQTAYTYDLEFWFQLYTGRAPRDG